MPAWLRHFFEQSLQLSWIVWNLEAPLKKTHDGTAANFFSSFTDVSRPPSVHLVGVGGIGMSALAQLLSHIGVVVSGSDRALDDPLNARIFKPLAASGLRLFPQDGSYFLATRPDALVFSSAIESDNPDFLAAGDTIPYIHRADMLSAAINSLQDRVAVAVAGSCGKTTVAAWLAETLLNLDYDPMMVGGGLSNSFVSANLAGNFRPGGGRQIVFEADESDKSLLEYSPDYALILNIGEDHYSKDELIELFSKFLGGVKQGCVISREVRDMLGESAVKHLRVSIFDASPSIKGNLLLEGAESLWSLDDYLRGSAQFTRRVFLPSGAVESETFTIAMPSQGMHMAANALAVLAMVDMLESAPMKEFFGDILDSRMDNADSTDDACGKHARDGIEYSGVRCGGEYDGLYRDWSLFRDTVSNFRGVWRRFDLLGYDSNGAEVRDDYAHNVDKILSAVATAKETAAKVFVVFQPHGFKPLEFMREDLFERLEATLAETDEFLFLPVFYAGGTTSFKPKSEDVCADFKRRGTKKYTFFASRDDVVCYLKMNTLRNDLVLILGARDNSLSEFASKIACKKIKP